MIERWPVFGTKIRARAVAQEFAPRLEVETVLCPVERFEARAAGYDPALIEHLGQDGAGDTGYAVCGSLTVAIEEDELAHLRQIMAGVRRWRAA